MTERQAQANSFRRWGYLAAKIDPLDRMQPFVHPEIQGFTDKEAKKWGEVYCGAIGAEFMHIPYQERCDWVANRLENPTNEANPRFILERIMEAELFERFLHTRYIGAKRFSLEGIASLIPLLDAIIGRAADLGFKTVMIAMSHRGRLTAMRLIINTPVSSILACFEDVDPRSVLGSGDVKYHKGATGTYTSQNGNSTGVRLASNPSHLESINPVVLGRVRADQVREKDEDYSKVLAIILHGDAAMAGQGINAEALNFATLPGFCTGGTVHIIVNNQIGFTAPPGSLHSSRFASDIAKRNPVPIFHVNAEKPVDVFRIGEIAMDYRASFKSDVFVDLIGYRRFGHNEGDDPSITLPVLYKKIKERPPLYQQYGAELNIPEAELKQLEEKSLAQLNSAQEKVKTITKQPTFATFADYWTRYKGGLYDPAFQVETAISPERLAEIAKRITTYPDNFSAHRKIQKLLNDRLNMSQDKRLVDWGMAEALALGSLLWDGHPVRIVGQDSRRGTFNHRQAVLFDTETEEEYIPLANLHSEQGWFQIYDSMLSEAASLGFEYGFSRHYPDALVCWEAQFGDFVNGAQICIDQFITAGEDKWSLLSGLVLLLPHGFEGQGPEHSSARIERFLQLAAEDNIQICQPSTSGQYFHLLRRQVLSNWRKPLIVFTPKSMLRLPDASSPVPYFIEGAFSTVLSDDQPAADQQRLLICTGKIIHALRREREKLGDTKTAIIGLEQMYPFPEEELKAEIEKYPGLKNVIWVQEEPKNMGALFFVRPRLKRLCKHIRVSSVKRSESASPATGSAKAHELEHRALLDMAFLRYS